MKILLAALLSVFSAFSVSNVKKVGDNAYHAEKNTVNTHGEATAGDDTYPYIIFKTENCTHVPGEDATAIYLELPNGDAELQFSDGGTCKVDVTESNNNYGVSDVKKFGDNVYTAIKTDIPNAGVKLNIGTVKCTHVPAPGSTALILPELDAPVNKVPYKNSKGQDMVFTQAPATILFSDGSTCNVIGFFTGKGKIDITEINNGFDTVTMRHDRKIER